MKIQAACLIAAALLSGCATVTRGTKDKFVIESTPEGALATLSSGETCMTPCEMKLPRKNDFTVTIEMAGYKSAEIAVSSEASNQGNGMLAGNIAIGGLIGLAVDSSTGAYRDLTPNPVLVTLEPELGEPMSDEMSAPEMEDSGEDVETGS